MDETPDDLAKRRRKLFVYRDALGLTNEDLAELAEYVCRRDIPSLKALTVDQLDRLLDGLELATLVLHLRG